MSILSSFIEVWNLDQIHLLIIAVGVKVRNERTVPFREWIVRLRKLTSLIRWIWREGEK